MDMNAAITQAFKLVKDGADIIDIGEKLTVCLIIIRYMWSIDGFVILLIVYVIC